MATPLHFPEGNKENEGHDRLKRNPLVLFAFFWLI
jgi:hypothetical protein